MKKGFLMTLLFVFSLSIGLAAFSDVSASHWAYESVMYLTELGIISGMPDGTFKGNEPMTRYQSAVAMKRLLDISASHSGGSQPIQGDLEGRLSELETLVNHSLNAVQRAGEDYREIMQRLENHSFEPVSSPMDYADLERMVDEILELKLDAKDFEGAMRETAQEVSQLKQDHQEIFTTLEMNQQSRRELANQVEDLTGQVNTYRWVAVSSAVIALGSMIMAGYVLLK